MDPTKINLKDVGDIVDGKLVLTENGWVVQGEETKSLDQILARFEGKHVRISVGDMALVQGLEQQVKDMAVQMTGMSAQEISDRLKGHRETALKLNRKARRANRKP